MKLPENSTTESLLKYIPKTLLERFCDRGGDLEKLWQSYQSNIQFRYITFRMDWQLDVVGGNAGDFRSWSNEFWQQIDGLPWGIDYKFSAPLRDLVLLGNKEFLPWILENKPELLTDSNVKVIAKAAAVTGNLEILQWIYDFQNSILEMQCGYDDNKNLALLAAQSGKVEVLDFLLNKAPHLFLQRVQDVRFNFNLNREFTEDKENLAHFAAYSGDVKTLDWVFVHYPQLFDVKLSLGNEIDKEEKRAIGNAAHCAAMTGSIEALDWFLIHKPELLKETTTFDHTIANFVAKSGNGDALAWVLNKYPELLTRVTQKDSTVFDYALESSNRNGNANKSIHYLLFEFPEYCQKLIDNFFAPKKIHLGILDFIEDRKSLMRYSNIDELLVAVTKEIMSRPISMKEKKFLDIFKEDWERALTTSDDYNLQELFYSKNNFTADQQKLITKISRLNTLKSVNGKDAELTHSRLNSLLGIVNSLYPSSKGLFFKKPQPLFLQRLNEFNHNVTHENLISNEILCLKVIVNDYAKGRLGEQTNMLDLLLIKLNETSTLQAKYYLQTDEERWKEVDHSFLPFEDLIKEYHDNEYLPYAELMLQQSAEEAKNSATAGKFILERHQEEFRSNGSYMLYRMKDLPASEWSKIKFDEELSKDVKHCLDKMYFNEGPSRVLQRTNSGVWI